MAAQIYKASKLAFCSVNRSRRLADSDGTQARESPLIRTLNHYTNNATAHNVQQNVTTHCSLS